ncbi:S-layer homology domain-containing protein [Alkaliphilus crotonatoxidans]
MKKGKIAIIIFTLILSVVMQTLISFGSTDLSYEEIERIIEEVAEEKNIPAVILKALAWKESQYQQFTSSGAPFVSRGNTGIMQINSIHKHFDQEKLKYDIKYNIEAGADILLGRWYASGTTYPKIGNMDPNILEHWYFALWGYNGWVARNNPNVSGEKAFQEEIFQLIRDKYQQPVTSIDASHLPASGLPGGDLVIPTPEIHHFAEKPVLFIDLVDHPKREYIEELFEKGIVSGVGNDLFLPDDPVTREQMTKILVDGFDLELISQEFAAVDYQKIVGWARDYFATAFDNGIVTTDEYGYINPKEYVTREEALIMLYNGLPDDVAPNIVEIPRDAIPFGDLEGVRRRALEAIVYFLDEEVIADRELFRPKEYITRGELCKWMYEILENIL